MDTIFENTDASVPEGTRLEIQAGRWAPALPFVITVTLDDPFEAHTVSTTLTREQAIELARAINAACFNVS